MSRLLAGLASALLLALAMGMSPSVHAQSILEAKTGDAFYYRGTGGISPP
jgi:hypothetical protein